MASRFYFENTVVNPSGITTIDSTWTDDARPSLGVPGQTLKLIPSGTIPSTTAYQTPQAQPALSTPPRYTMHAMFQYTLPADLLITGNVSGELAGFRQNNGNNVSRSIAAHIRNGTTHKATVVQAFTATNFYGFTPGHVEALLATPIVDDGYITVPGDILYLEIGLGWAVVVGPCNVTLGYNNANSDWPDGADGTPDTNPTVKNPWFQFDTTLATAPAADDFLLTLSGSSSTSRPSAPSKPGLHFFARDTNIESIWNGSAWKEMVSSLNANGGTAVGGNITFNNTTSVNVSLTSKTFTWTQNYAAPSGGYGTSATAGTAGTTSIASDARFVYPEALAPVADRTKTLTITDDASFGCMLTGANNFTQNMITLIPPNRVSTNVFIVGRYGNVQSGAATYDETVQFRMTRTDTLTSSTLQGFNVSVTNTDVGLGNIACKGGAVTATASMASAAGASSTITAFGFDMTAIGGAGGNNNFQGSVFGIRALTQVLAQTAGNPVSLLNPIQTGGSVSRAAVSDFIGLNFKIPGTILSGTVANYFGSVQDAMTLGTTRIGHKVNGATTGTPTTVTSFWAPGHSVGTTRRSVIGDNTLETATYFYCNAASKGLVMRDTQGTIHYWALYTDATGTKDATYTMDDTEAVTTARGASATGNVILTISDTGTSPPAT